MKKKLEDMTREEFDTFLEPHMPLMEFFAAVATLFYYAGDVKFRQWRKDNPDKCAGKTTQAKLLAYLEETKSDKT